MSVSAYTASVLACRKLLMNIAVAQGAAEGKKFAEYVQYLADNGYVPPNGKGWVDHIRKKGNEATHEIPHMERGDAEELIAFAEMLLKFIYEFPARYPPPSPKRRPNEGPHKARPRDCRANHTPLHGDQAVAAEQIGGARNRQHRHAHCGRDSGCLARFVSVDNVESVRAASLARAGQLGGPDPPRGFSHCPRGP